MKRIIVAIFALSLICGTAFAGQLGDTGGFSGGAAAQAGGGGGGGVSSVSGAAPVTSTGTSTPQIGCATCTTNAAALTSNVLVKGAGGQATQTSSVTDDGTTVSTSEKFSAGLGTFTSAKTGCFALATTGTVTINWDNGDCQYLAQTGNVTLAAPINPVVGKVYTLIILNNVHTLALPSSFKYWHLIFGTYTAATNTAAVFAQNSGIVPVVLRLNWDGTQYLEPEYDDLSVLGILFTGSIQNNGATNLAGGLVTVSGGNLSVTTGNIISSTGGALPTVTCTGGATGASVTAGSTNNRGQITTSSSSSTACTLTWSAAATWPQAPVCIWQGHTAAVTGLADGACGTSTCVVNFSSATSQVIDYLCM